VTKAVTVSNSTIRLHGPYTPYMGRRGRMVGRFVTMKYVSIVVSSNPTQANSVQHIVIQFLIDLQQVGGFLRVLWFPPIKLTATI
jgi:hypothetical protein